MRRVCGQTWNAVDTFSGASLVLGEERGPVAVQDLLGRRIRTVVNTDTEGRTEPQLDVSGLAPGTYFLRMQTDDHTDTQRITVVR